MTREEARQNTMDEPLPNNGTRHVSPAGDLIEHEIDYDGDCICGPECISKERVDGSLGWIYVHHALDGRL